MANYSLSSKLGYLSCLLGFFFFKFKVKKQNKTAHVMDNSRAALCSKGAHYIKMKDEVPYDCLNAGNGA